MVCSVWSRSRARPDLRLGAGNRVHRAAAAVGYRSSFFLQAASVRWPEPRQTRPRRERGRVGSGEDRFLRAGFWGDIPMLVSSWPFRGQLLFLQKGAVEREVYHIVIHLPSNFLSVSFPNFHCLIQNLHAGSGEIDDLVVDHHHVDCSGSPQVLEVQSQLRSTASISTCVGALSRRHLEALSNDEHEAAELEGSDAREIAAHVSCSRESQSPACFQR